MILSPANLELLRTRPQSTRLKLSIFQPRTIFQARVNNVNATKGDREIIYDTVTLGSFGLIEAGMTLLVGTHVAGAQNIGKIRIISATSTTITVSENSNIFWSDNQFLTVQRYWELWPVYPRIIADPADAENRIFYKDYDIPYTNQNSILGTFANAGPHRAAYITTGSSVSLWYSSTGTYNLLGDSLNYNWAFEGGTPTGSSSANPGYVSYTTPGHYVTRLIVSGSSGGVDTTYRCVSIYNAANPPPLKWEMTGPDGSRDEGGYQASFKIQENIDVQEGAVVVVFSDDWYGNTNQSLGGNYPNAENIFYVGYILKDTIRYDYRQSSVEFETASITELMKKSLGFSISVESKASPTKWYELLDLDCRRAIYHYLRWHTTALYMSDFQFVGTDYKIQFFDADRASMFDAVDNLMRGTLIGSSVSDRQGKTWIEVDAQAYSNPTGTFTSVMDITNRDWMGEPSIEERLSDELSYLEMGGIAYSGVVTGTYSAFLASAPGNAPGFRGSIETHEGLALASRVQLRKLVGNVWANRNSQYPSLGMDMAISPRNLDIAPQETALIHVAASDTVRNLAIDGVFIPNGIGWKYDAKNGLLLAGIDFKSLVNGRAGDGLDIPVPETDNIGGGFDVPPIEIPIIPPFTLPPESTDCCDDILEFSASSGIHCLTLNKLETVYTASYHPTGTFTLFPETSNNPYMYNPQSGTVTVLITGTYDVTLQGDWQYLGVGGGGNSLISFYALVIESRDPFPGPTSGHDFQSTTINVTSLPRTLRLILHTPLGAPPNSTDRWDNVRATICKR